MPGSLPVARAGIALGTFVALAWASACTSLPAAEPGTCGNGLVEPERGEDCDRDGDCGAPGTATACRLVCTTTADCPAGAVCGDGVCSVPDGQFVQRGAASFASAFVVVGDVDGDADRDLVGIDDVRLDVHRGDPGAGFTAATPIANLPSVSVPRLADVTGDGRADLVTSVAFGINLTIGDSDRLFTPTLQKTFVFDAVGPVRTAALRYQLADGEHVVSAATVRAGPGLIPGCSAGCNVLTVGDEGALLPVGRDLDRIVGPQLPWARRPSAPGQPRVTLAVAYGDAPMVGDQSAIDVYVIDLSAQDPVPVMLATTLTTAQGQIVGAGVADLNGDGWPEVVAVVESTGGRRLMVARGVPGGGVDPLRVLDIPTMPPTGGRAPLPLAWLDVDDDGDGELVTEDRVFDVETCVEGTQWTCVRTELLSSEHPWGSAHVGDVNGDGRADLVANRRDLGTVDVFLGSTTRHAWNPAPFVNERPVAGLRIGDFDGNDVDDIALLVPPATAGDEVEIRVAFGVLRGRPGAPIGMGTLEKPESIEVVRDTDGIESDGIDDLVAFARGDANLSVSFLSGSTSQRLVAPLVPTPEMGLTGEVFTVYPVVVPLTDGTTPGVIATLATSLGRPDAQAEPTILRNSLRFLYADSGGRLTEEYVGPLTIPDFDPVFAHWTAALAPGQDPRLAGVDLEGRLLIAPITGCPGSCAVGAPVRVTTGAPGTAAAIAGLDLDGVGAAEVVMAFAAPLATSEIVIARDAGATLERLPLPAGAEPRAVAAATIAVGKPRLLVVATSSGVYTAAPDAGGRYGAFVPLVDTSDRGLGAESAVGVHAADVDEDGLDDLVVTEGPDLGAARNVTIYTQGQVPGGAGVLAGEGR